MEARASDNSRPIAHDAEKALIGSILLGYEDLDALSLEPVGFSSRLGEVFGVCLEMRRRDDPVPINSITLADELEKRNGLLNAIGGTAELARLQLCVPGDIPTNAPEYARIINERFQNRSDSETDGIEKYGRGILYDLRYYATNDGANVEFLIDEWIAADQITLTAAREKLGKTTQALRRAEAVSNGGRYLASENFNGYSAKKGRVLLMTETSADLLRQLIEDDRIEDIEYDNFRVTFIDDYEPRDRIAALRDLCNKWNPAYVILDPIDECLGFEAETVKNSSDVGHGFTALQSLARTGITFEGLYHLNKLDIIANSYKFQAKPDHIFTAKGTDASEITYTYKGRLRSIPRVRRVSGNGESGYRVEVITGGTTAKGGRPNETETKILACLRESDKEMGPGEIAAQIGSKAESVRVCLSRMERKKLVQHPERGLYRLAQGRT